MRTFKLIDFYTQIGLMIGSLLLLAIDSSSYWYFYLIVGGFQLISVLVHLLLRQSYYAAPKRKYYHCALLAVAAGVPSTHFLYFALLLFITPVMALWYLVICRSENEKLAYKKLIHLK